MSDPTIIDPDSDVRHDATQEDLDAADETKSTWMHIAK